MNNPDIASDWSPLAIIKTACSEHWEWIVVATLITADALLLISTGFYLTCPPIFFTLAACGFLATVRQIYGRWRPAPRLASLANTGLALILFTVSVEILDYILTGILPLPRCDTRLVAWDRALGFDWRDWYVWVIHHPMFHAIFYAVYGLLGPEMLALFIMLELSGHTATSSAFLRRFILTAMITVFIGTLMPAAGAFVYYHLPVAAHTGYVPVMADLRNGTLRNINLFKGQGLVVFPSFHTTLAILCVAATWPWHKLRLPMLLFNLLIIFSAISEGGHYLVDILAGLLLGVMAIAFIHPTKTTKK